MTRDNHETDHTHGGSHEHHSDDLACVSFGVLTVSSSRTLESDESGDAIVEAIESAGHSVQVHDLVTDDEDAIRDGVRTFLDDEVDAIVTTGGTGLTADDVTPDALDPLFDREIPGFGEQFRARSIEQVGPHGLLTRAKAGVIEDVPVFCLPGSESATDFGVSELVVPVVGHVVGLVGTGSDSSDRTDADGQNAQGGQS